MNWKGSTFHSILIIIIILGAPVIAIATGYFTQFLNYTTVTPGIIFTGGIVFPVLFLFSLKNKSATIILFYVGLLIVLISISYNLATGNEVDISSFLNRLFKIVFPFLGFSFLKFIHEKRIFIEETILWKLGFYYGLITAVSIVVFTILGVRVESVRGIEFTSSGLYGGGNDTGLILLISYSLFGYYNQEYQKRRLSTFLAVTILYFSAGLLIGTRTTLLGLPTILLIILIAKYFSRKKKPSIYEKIGLLILIVGFIVAGVYLVQFMYTNDMGKTIARVQEMTSDEYKVRGRVPKGVEEIKSFNLVEHMFGAGEARFALVENDIVDIYGKFGLLFFVMVYGSCLSFLFSISKMFLQKRSMATMVLCMGLSLYFIHGSLAGHAFASAQVNNLIMIVYFLIYRHDMKWKKINSVRALNIVHE